APPPSVARRRALARPAPRAGRGPRAAGDGPGLVRLVAAAHAGRAPAGGADSLRGGSAAGGGGGRRRRARRRRRTTRAAGRHALD
ncbi:MAG: hypothetical protein AVDCRST_MAG11-3409, partial [uncultured Gemmatimonadaceae bacterium]